MSSFLSKSISTTTKFQVEPSKFQYTNSDWTVIILYIYIYHWGRTSFSNSHTEMISQSLNIVACKLILFYVVLDIKLTLINITSESNKLFFLI
jgi:hypothetical protein